MKECSKAGKIKKRKEAYLDVTCVKGKQKIAPKEQVTFTSGRTNKRCEELKVGECETNHEYTKELSS
jgi:hypothetical protein